MSSRQAFSLPTKFVKLWSSNGCNGSRPPSKRSILSSSLMHSRSLQNQASPEGLKADAASDFATTVISPLSESLKHADYFQVNKSFTIRDLFNARVHLGHKEGGRNPLMNDFIFGSRFGMDIIDLDLTAFHLRQALNFTAHISFRKGVILFVTRTPHAVHLVEKTAMECGEFAHCREWDVDVLTNSERKFGGITRLPDLIIVLSTLDTVMLQHGVVTAAAKMLIPTIGIVDTNCNPNLVTYPIPGNDDTLSAIEFYCKLFKEAILRGKEKVKTIEKKNL